MAEYSISGLTYTCMLLSPKSDCPNGLPLTLRIPFSLILEIVWFSLG